MGRPIEESPQGMVCQSDQTMNVWFWGGGGGGQNLRVAERKGETVERGNE